MKLSIVIPTLNRPALLAETVTTILPQLKADIELLIVDASRENPCSIRHEHTRCETGVAKGFDEAYEEAVGKAKGEWVWLFSDDDWFKAGAVEAVLPLLKDDVDLLVLNAEIRDSEMKQVLKSVWVSLPARRYDASHYNEMFADLGDLGTFVGSLVIRRSVWEERMIEGRKHFGTRFITFILPFMCPTSVQFVDFVCVSVRFGHQNWMRSCAQLIGKTLTDIVWSFPLEEWSKTRVRPRKPPLGELILWHAVHSDVSQWSPWIHRIPRGPLKWAFKLLLKLTGKSGGVSDYMLQRS